MPDEQATFAIPRVTTERLILREPRLSEFERYASWSADPTMMRFISGVTDRRQAWRSFCSIGGNWALTGAGWWSIEERATGEYIGSVGAFFRETTLGQPDQPLEMGWSLFPPFWRRGFAREAAEAALRFSAPRHQVPRIIATTDPDNVASAAVALAIGMKLDGPHDYYGQPGTRYAIEREAALERLEPQPRRS